MASEFDGGLDETEDEDEDKGTLEVIEVDESDDASEPKCQKIAKKLHSSMSLFQRSHLKELEYHRPVHQNMTWHVCLK